MARIILPNSAGSPYSRTLLAGHATSDKRLSPEEIAAGLSLGKTALSIADVAVAAGANLADQSQQRAAREAARRAVGDFKPTPGAAGVAGSALANQPELPPWTDLGLLPATVGRGKVDEAARSVSPLAKQGAPVLARAEETLARYKLPELRAKLARIDENLADPHFRGDRELMKQLREIAQQRIAVAEGAEIPPRPPVAGEAPTPAGPPPEAAEPRTPNERENIEARQRELGAERTSVMDRTVPTPPVDGERYGYAEGPPGDTARLNQIDDQARLLKARLLELDGKGAQKTDAERDEYATRVAQFKALVAEKAQVKQQLQAKPSVQVLLGQLDTPGEPAPARVSSDSAITTALRERAVAQLGSMPAPVTRARVMDINTALQEASLGRTADDQRRVLDEFRKGGYLGAKPTGLVDLLTGAHRERAERQIVQAGAGRKEPTELDMALQFAKLEGELARSESARSTERLHTAQAEELEALREDKKRKLRAEAAAKVADVPGIQAKVDKTAAEILKLGTESVLGRARTGLVGAQEKKTLAEAGQVTPLAESLISYRRDLAVTAKKRADAAITRARKTGMGGGKKATDRAVNDALRVYTDAIKAEDSAIAKLNEEKRRLAAANADPGEKPTMSEAALGVGTKEWAVKKAKFAAASKSITDITTQIGERTKRLNAAREDARMLTAKIRARADRESGEPETPKAETPKAETPKAKNLFAK